MKLPEAMAPRPRSPGEALLFLAPQKEAELRAAWAADRLLIPRELILKRTEALLAKPAPEHSLVGPRLLHMSRQALGIILHTAFVWRMTGEDRWRDEAVRTLDTVCAFPDWNPKHFLDVGEMALGVALGLDWLHDALTPEQRDRYRAALVKHALQPAMEAHKTGAHWVSAFHNWNPVCYGGLLAATALAWDDDPERAGMIARKAVARFPVSLEEVAPDGVYPEGPTYWDYGMSYSVVLIETARTAYGLDVTPWIEAPGVEASGTFAWLSTGPTGYLFNFADCGAVMPACPVFFWMAREYDRPELAAHALELLAAGRADESEWVTRPGLEPVLPRWTAGQRHRLLPLGLVWGPEALEAEAAARPRPDMTVFRGEVPVVFFTGGATHPDRWMALKGGDNETNHAHLDLGHFVLEAGGVRWSIDLGKEHYNLPKFFSKGEDAVRWDYFRNSSFSHSVPVLNGDRQRVVAKAPLLDVAGGDGVRSVSLDLSAAYEPHARKLIRTFSWRADGTVVITDEIEVEAPTAFAWQLITAAEIELGEADATLHQDGKALGVTTAADSVALRWGEQDNRPPSEDEQPNTGTCRLVGEASLDAGTHRVSVMLQLPA